MAWFNEWAYWYLGLGKYTGHRRQKSWRPPAPKRIPARAWSLLLSKFSALLAERRLRNRIVAYLLWGCQPKVEPKIHYQQKRAMEWLKQAWRLKSLPRWADCSEFYTDACAWAGAPDPNGLGYSGLGNTNTLWANLPKITKDELEPGDAIIFGTYPRTSHVVGVVEVGSDPLVVSHGMERGPIKLPLSEEAGYHKNESISYRRAFKAAV
jgi:hypothetical protein